jgi:hypothetical protein
MSRPDYGESMTRGCAKSEIPKMGRARLIDLLGGGEEGKDATNPLEARLT